MSELAVSPSADAGQIPPMDLGAAIPSDAPTTPNQLISFAIGDDQYGVDIMAVREIKGWTAITSLPKQPEYVRGVLNLRGVIVPIVDLRCRFGQGLTEATPMHIVIIVQIASKPVGLARRPRPRHRLARCDTNQTGTAGGPGATTELSVRIGSHRRCDDRAHRSSNLLSVQIDAEGTA